MKKLLILLFLVMLAVLVDVSVYADEYVKKGKIGLYADVERAGWCADGTPYYYFDMYLFIQPDENGVRAVEFMIDNPENVVTASTFLNEAIVASTLGSPETGMAMAYFNCMRDWHWTLKRRMLVLDSEPSIIRLDAYPADIVEGLDVASCIEPSRPIFLLHRQADLYVNHCGEAVWPAWLDSSTVDGPNSVILNFADQLSEVKAEDTDDYIFVNRLDSAETLAASSAEVLADGRSVLLTMASPFPAGHPYILEINDDTDTTKGGNILRTGAGLCPDIEIRGIYPPEDEDSDAARYPVDLIIRNNGGVDAGPFPVRLELKHRVKIGYAWYYRTLITYEWTVDGLSAGTSITETICADLRGREYQYIDFIATIDYPGPEEDCYLENNELFRQNWPDPPLLESVSDVADDNGGWVRLIFYKSGYKTASDAAEFYEVYCRQSGAGTDDCGCIAGLCGEWELRRTIPSEDTYSYSKWVETPCDYSSSSPDCTFDFIVAAVEVTETGDTLRHYSEIKTGFSRDNIVPEQPQSLMAVQNGNDLYLSWASNQEDDLAGYRLYRFCPDINVSWDLIAEPVDTFYLDANWYIGSGCSYYLTAVDGGGNESEANYISPEEMIGTLLEQYTASLRGDAVRIEWTLNEVDPGVIFHILRSQDGTRFVEISSIPAGEGVLEYLFEDDEVESGEDYIYRVEFEKDGRRRVLLETEKVEIPELPLTLEQNVPNPFNPSTSISFYLPEAAGVRLDVFDVSGRMVKTLKNEHFARGSHKIEWDGRDSNGAQAVSGVYFYRLIAGKERLSRKMILLR